MQLVTFYNAKVICNENLSAYVHRRSHIDAPFPEEILPGGVPEDPGAGARQQLLQVRQPGAPAVHVVAVPRRPDRDLLRILHDEAAWAEAHHAHRRGLLHPRGGVQCRRPGPRHAHRWTDLARLWRWLRQPGNPSKHMHARAQKDHFHDI